MRIITLLMILCLSLPVTAAVHTDNETGERYSSTYILRGRYDVETKGFKIIEDMYHFLNRYPIQVSNGIVTIDVEHKYESTFRSITREYTSDDFRFAMGVLGLKTAATKQLDKDQAYEALTKAIEKAVKDFQTKEPVIQNVKPQQNAPTFVMRDPNDVAILDSIKMTMDYAHDLAYNKTKRWPLPPLAINIKARINAHLDWLELKQTIEALGAKVIVLDGTNNGQQDYLETFVRDVSFKTADKIIFPNFAENPARLFRQSEIYELKKQAEKMGLQTINLTDGFFEGGDIHDGDGILWVGYSTWEKGTKYTDRKIFAELSKFAGKPVMPAPLIDKEFYHLDTAFRELPKGEILYYPAAFDDDFNRRLQKAGYKLIKLTKADAKELATNLVAVGNTLIMNAGISAELQKVLKHLGYKLVLLPARSFIGNNKHCLVNILQ